MHLRMPSLFFGVLFTFLLASESSALAIDSTNSGLDQGVGCADTACLTVLYGLTVSGPITGSVEISGWTLSFSIQLASANFAASGGGDGSVTSVDFMSVIYSGSVTVMLDGSNNYIVESGQLATVSGTVIANTASGDGAGGSSSIAGNTVLVTGLCSGTPGSALQCGLIFGPAVDFSADVNGNVRYFRNTVDALAAIPEPGTAILLGLGLLVMSRTETIGRK